jgi:hypothetical protein
MSKYATFQKIISVLVVISFLGCSTHQPIEAQRSELQYKIRHENILKISDDVKIITDDGKKYQFRITSIDETEIVGVQKIQKTKDVTAERTLTTTPESIEKTYRIPIDSIVVLETKEFSWGKTAMLTGGIVVVLGLIVVISAVAAMSLSLGSGHF